MNRSKLSFPFFAALLFLLSACVNDEKKTTTGPVTKDQLAGKWELVNASRNGRETQSLEGTTILIDGTKMTCNFTGEPIETPLNFSNSQLQQNDQVYKITRITNDSLWVNTELMNFQFEMTFIKAN